MCKWWCWEEAEDERGSPEIRLRCFTGGGVLSDEVDDSIRLLQELQMLGRSGSNRKAMTYYS